MSTDEVSGTCTSGEETVVSTSPSKMEALNVRDLCLRLGHRSIRRTSRTEPGTPGEFHRLKIMPTKLSDLAVQRDGSRKRTKIVGRFASQDCSPESTPALTAYNSSDSDSERMKSYGALNTGIQMDLDVELEANDADDEAEVREMLRRGRSRRSRQVLIGRK
jgi:hypothetical protein